MWPRLLHLALLLVSATLQAQEPDVIRMKISAAKELFFKERDKAEQKLIELLTRQEQAIKQAGDLNALEALRAEISGFRNEGKVPQLVSVKEYETAYKTAFAKYEKAYLEGIKSYTKQDQIFQAKDLQAELEKVRADYLKIPPAVVDVLQPNSVWSHTAQAQTLTITSRKNGKFEGVVNEGNKITWLAKDTTVVKGGKTTTDHYGTVVKDEQGYKLVIDWKRPGAAGQSSMRLQAK